MTDKEDTPAERHLQDAERAVGAIADITSIAPREVRKVGIIGSGTMGGGIAMAFANAQIPVVLLDVEQGQLDRGIGVIRQNYAASVKRGRLAAEDMEARLGLIRGTTQYPCLADVDLVIEAVFEDMQLKKQIFGELERVTRPGTVLATNTSTLDINQIARSTGRPGDVIGLHFFSPAHVTRLLEIVRTDTVSAEVLATGFAVARRLRKLGVVSKVSYGFIGNRMMDPYAREAERLVLEGATPSQVDGALEAFGMGMGILAVYDMAGIDVGVKVRKANPEHVPREDPTFYRSSQVLFDHGWLGQKSGKGYYRYEPGSRDRLPHDEAVALLHEEGRRLGVARSEPITNQEIVERCLYAMINEGARLLEEGVARGPGDIDVVYTAGYAFPRHRGGPMYYADQIGLATVLAGVEKYGRQGNPASWRPSALLQSLARSGSSFAAWQQLRAL